MGLFSIFSVLALAFGNGANDNFKGVATLYGSKQLSYKQALMIATGATLLGAAVAVFMSASLVLLFQGKGILPQDLMGAESVILAVSLGAAVTVLVASFIGLPVSTTHALAGALVGVSLVAIADGGTLGPALWKIGVPLAVSPLLAVGLAVGGRPIATMLRRRLGVVKAEGDVAPHELYSGKVLTADANVAQQRLHIISGGLVCFGRAVNDTPKLAAMLLALPLFTNVQGMLIVGVLMAIGGVVYGRRVAETIGRKITDIEPGSGLVANLITAALVLGASRLGVPVSTTHVSVGAIFGIGIIQRSARWKMVWTILLAWLTTLPMAAVISAIIYLLAT